MNWQREKPDYPCVFVSRYSNKEDGNRYTIWRFEFIDVGCDKYLAWLTEDFEEYDDISCCEFDEYLILEKLEQ